MGHQVSGMLYKVDETDPCFDCYYYDEESGMCESHEGCVKEEDRQINN